MALIIDNEHRNGLAYQEGVEITRLRFDVPRYSLEEIKQRVIVGKMSINAARVELGLPPLKEFAE